MKSNRQVLNKITLHWLPLVDGPWPMYYAASWNQPYKTCELQCLEYWTRKTGSNPHLGVKLAG